MLEAEACEQKGWPCPLDSRGALGVPSGSDFIRVAGVPS